MVFSPAQNRLRIHSHPGTGGCCSVKMHLGSEISTEIIKWQRQAMEQFTDKNIGVLEDLKLSESQQCCASTNQPAFSIV